MKIEITIEEFKERYWKEELNNLFNYIQEIKIFMNKKDRVFKEITTEVHNKKWDNFEVWNYVKINWVWVTFEERLYYYNK